MALKCLIPLHPSKEEKNPKMTSLVELCQNGEFSGYFSLFPPKQEEEVKLGRKPRC